MLGCVWESVRGGDAPWCMTGFTGWTPNHTVLHPFRGLHLKKKNEYGEEIAGTFIFYQFYAEVCVLKELPPLFFCVVLQFFVFWQNAQKAAQQREGAVWSNTHYLSICGEGSGKGIY